MWKERAGEWGLEPDDPIPPDVEALLAKDVRERREALEAEFARYLESMLARRRRQMLIAGAIIVVAFLLMMLTRR